MTGARAPAQRVGVALPRWEILQRLLGDRLSPVLALLVSSVVSALAEAGILAIAAQVATSLVADQSHVTMDLGVVTIRTTVTSLLTAALVMAILRLLLMGIASYYTARIASDVQARMRNELFGAFSMSAWDTQSADREGHFQELMTNQVFQATQGAFNATVLVVALSTLVILAVSAFALNVVTAAVILGTATGLFFVLRPLTTLGARLSREFSDAQVEYAGAVSEANSVAEETQVFGTMAAQRNRLEGSIATTRRLFMRTQLIGRLVPNIYQSAIYIILVLGLIVVDQAHIGTFASLGAVILILVRAGSYGQQVQISYQALRQAIPFVERILATTERYRTSECEYGDLPLERVHSLAFERVGYAYRSDRPVLAGLSFEVQGGETIGVVGPSGAGKSTMVQILLRLRATQEGQFLVNEVPVAQYAPRDWSRQVVYVPQQPRLVYASVADNVRFFRDIDDEAVKRACRLAQIHDEIVSWPQGYDTIVGPRAEAVSGGQQQRICLARAIAVEPAILVLDEPTSALDPQSEALIQESLQMLKEWMTLFIVAHRMSTLTICDRVMVIIKGELTAFDTLESLHFSNEYFQLASAIAGTSAGSADKSSSDAAVALELEQRKARRPGSSRG